MAFPAGAGARHGPRHRTNPRESGFEQPSSAWVGVQRNFRHTGEAAFPRTECRVRCGPPGRGIARGVDRITRAASRGPGVERFAAVPDVGPARDVYRVTSCDALAALAPSAPR